MRCLIRYLTRQSKSGIVYQDKTFSGKTLTIGRAVDQAVFLADLRVALRHAVITDLLDGRFLLQSKSPSGVRVNDRLLQSSPITQGDCVNLGNSELRVISPPPTFDFALEVETKKPAAETISRMIPTLSSAGLRMRRWSWLLFLSIFILFLGIPAGAVYLHDYYAPLLSQIETYLSTPEQTYELPPLPHLLSDKFWDSGELASAHYFFRNDCNACHQQAFVRVQDKACINCHRKTHPHADPEFFDLELLNTTRCAECHKDHNGKKALVRQDDTLCSSCHKDLSRQGITTQLGDASDFEHNHPPFKFTMLRFAEDKEFIERVGEMDENYRETSNLEFSHAKHVSKEGLSTIEGIFRLWCDDCHTHRAGQADMQPINFEKHCQRCHPLSFEPMDPYREAPHGKISEVLYTLQEYYGNRALKGNYPEAGAPSVVQEEHFPDEELSGEEISETLNWARRKAEEIGEELFEFNGCINCHRVNRLQDSPPQWEIMPVKLNQNWLPKSNFSHESHKTMKCLFCHAGPESEYSSDILIPSIEACQECHGGVHASDKLQSTCVDCHVFHVAAQFSMGKTERTQ